MNEIKRYVNRVEWNLRLDWPTRVRVMNDLASDLQSRLEAGETLADIRADLGGPEQLAATLNEAFADHRDPAPRWRWWLLAGAAAALALGFALPALTGARQAAVGVIGGADGPTAILVSGPGISGGTLLGISWALLLAAAFCWLGWCRHGHPRRYWLPALLSLIVCAGQGVLLALGWQPGLPVYGPLSILAGFLLSGFWLGAALLVLSLRGALKKRGKRG